MNTNEKIYELAIRMQSRDAKTGIDYDIAHYIELAKSIYEKGCLDRALNLLNNN